MTNGSHSAETSDLSPGTLCQLLRSSVRRRLLITLREDSQTTSVDGLINRLRVDGKDADEDSGRDWRTELHHVHLPVLEANGVIEWSKSRDEVSYRPTSRLESLLDLFERWERRD